MRAFDLLSNLGIGLHPVPGPQNALFGQAQVTAQAAVELRRRISLARIHNRMVYRVVGATRLSLFRLSLRLVLATDERIVLDTVTLRSGGRIRNWSSRLGNSVLVENGIMPSANGQETGWMTRCDMRQADRGLLPFRHRRPQRS